MNDFQLLPVEAGLAYTADFSEELPASVTLASVVWSITPSITLAGQVDSLGTAQSTIRVSGASHGVTYNLQAKATLSNGEIVVKDIALIGFNG